MSGTNEIKITIIKHSDIDIQYKFSGIKNEPNSEFSFAGKLKYDVPDIVDFDYIATNKKQPPLDPSTSSAADTSVSAMEMDSEPGTSGLTDAVKRPARKSLRNQIKKIKISTIRPIRI